MSKMQVNESIDDVYGIMGLEVYNTKLGEVEMKDYDTDIYLILK